MKKILFVHIPKAGGSSVNKIFTDFFSENLTAVHLESNEIWSNRVDRIALVERCKYISGHLVLEDFRVYAAHRGIRYEIRNVEGKQYGHSSRSLAVTGRKN
ncbi:MAG: hypothetical protein EBZ48_15295 [Proteobacteria bacterium]|nr:hypothetical protein [Pseudomonadota bacterium]